MATETASYVLKARQIFHPSAMMAEAVAPPQNPFDTFPPLVDDPCGMLSLLRTPSPSNLKRMAESFKHAAAVCCNTS